MVETPPAAHTAQRRPDIPAAGPETEMLLLCASPARDSACDSRIRELIAGGLDWQYLQELAGSHRLTQLLYWGVKAAKQEAVPVELERQFQQNTRFNLFRTGELLRVVDLLEHAGIPAIPFKGPTLAVRAYNSLVLRTFDDLDILIRPSDVWKARDLLLGDGYETNLRLQSGLQDAYLRSYDEVVLSGQDGNSLLELHWAFVPPHFSVALDMSGFWERRDPVLLGSREVMALGTEDLVLVLCIHGSKHCWSHLGLVCDLAWLITGNPVDWETLLQRAREVGAHRMVLLGVFLAFQVFNVPLAAAVARDVSLDPAVPVLAAEMLQSLFGARHDERAMVRSGLLHMRMRERPQDRLRYFFRLAMRPGIEDWQAIELPRPLSFLYRVLRFPRLLRKYWSRKG